jgi:alkanesulfonate monooxygenase SsuD/methylene tetrahydromethanopterin reductase-like flavin-dependent oxidoreductase (luciferase family)
VVAGATERPRLVTSVLVLRLRYRYPVLTAKMVATLDVLSGGRLTLGIGTGWLKEEFEALNSPDFSARGAVTDEWITICKQLWFQSPASFDGGSIGTPIFAANLFPCRSPTPNLGRRGFPRRPAPHRPAWRWLASGRRGRGLAVTASRDARPSGDPETADGS